MNFPGRALECAAPGLPRPAGTVTEVSLSDKGPKDEPGKGPGGGERIAKVMARAGLCSRREAEVWIGQGRVSVDGEVLKSPAVTVNAENQVLVDGKPLPEAEAPRIWRYHKPRDQVTSNYDPAGRPTVYDALPPDMPRVLSIGRLDINSEGLLLFTNDGGVKRRLELPSSGWTRRYRVRVYGQVDQKTLAKLAEGVTVEGVAYGPIEASLERAGRTNAWLSMALKEGKNREIRRVCEHLGLKVSRLIRLSYGAFQLGSLGPGEVREIPAKVVREQLGLADAENPSGGYAKAKSRTKKRPPKRDPKRSKAKQEGKPGGPDKKPDKKAGKARGHADRRRPA